MSPARSDYAVFFPSWRLNLSGAISMKAAMDSQSSQRMKFWWPPDYFSSAIIIVFIINQYPEHCMDLKWTYKHHIKSSLMLNISYTGSPLSKLCICLLCILVVLAFAESLRIWTAEYYFQNWHPCQCRTHGSMWAVIYFWKYEWASDVNLHGPRCINL